MSAEGSLLAIDTATELCSAALLTGEVIRSRELATARGHAEHILPMVDELLAESGVRLTELTAVAFGRGPGGFTGVRLAASVAQGLAFGAARPVVPVSDLAAVAQRVLAVDPGAHRVLVCNDARMQEVYWGCFTRDAQGLAMPEGPERVGPAAAVALPPGWSSDIVGAGRGFRIYVELAARVARVYDDFLPRAAEIAQLAVREARQGRLKPPEDAIPVYLRDDVAQPPSSG